MTGHLLSLVLGLVLTASVLVLLGSIWFAGKYGHTDHFARRRPEQLRAILEPVYFLGIPYLTLITGLVPARFFGLKGVEFFTPPNFNQSWSRFIGAFLTQIGNISLTWLSDFSLMATTGPLLGAIFGLYLWVYLQIIKPNFAQSEKIIYQSKLEIIFDAVHWTFYRASIWLISGNIYLGVVGGAGLVMLEYIFSSYLGKFSTLSKQQYLFRFNLGLVAAIAFLLSPHLWFIIIFHLALAMLSNGLFRIVGRARTNSL